ncbi:hypothetical protein [Streptomyces sp. NPDC048442]|uniref:hypothetical protein n=1 Tax=Streptomyces sp. NPDC048442 TaxID=3154823 RepID=UPI003426B972
MNPSTSRGARSRPLSRIAATLGLALVLASGALATAGTAQAQPVESGSLSFAGDDWIGGGESYAYSVENKDKFSVTSNKDQNVISVSVNAANGSWWSLDLADGKALKAGSYPGAIRYPFNDAGQPGLSLSGDGRGCNTLTGSFDIAQVVFGPNGYVQKLDATFVQHCEGGDAATKGEIHISNPEPPAELSLGLDVSLEGQASTLNGKATVHGKVSCDVPAQVEVAGDVTQVKNKVIIRGAYSTSVACTPGAPVAWTAKAVPTGTTPFQKGLVEVEARASAVDPNYGNTVTVSRTEAVRLVKG